MKKLQSIASLLRRHLNLRGERHARPGFISNTLWTWCSAGVSIAAAVVVTPLMVKRLGDERYGLWILVFSLVEYSILLDFGMRPALIKYVAQHWNRGQTQELNQTLNAGLTFLAVAASVLVVLTVILAPLSGQLFGISAEMETEFVQMILIAGIGWCISLLFHVFASCLDAIQRFDVSNRIQILTNLVRVSAIIGLLLAGFGLRALVTAAVATRLLQCLMLWRAFAHQVPEFRWSITKVDWATLRTLFRFGMHHLPLMVGFLLIGQGPVAVIGRMMPERFVGYFALPSRLLAMFLDLVGRLGVVTNARASELLARGDQGALIRLGIRVNRYSVLLLLPGVLFLIIYGDALFRVWLTPEFAALSAPLLPVFGLAVIFSEAAQVSSISILYALAKHGAYAWAILCEAVLGLVLIAYFAAAGDLWTAAVAVSVMKVLNQGFLAPYLLCRYLNHSVLHYISQILARPVALGLVASGTMWLCRVTWLPAQGVPGLALAAAIGSIVIVLGAGRFCVFPEDRTAVLDLIQRRVPAITGLVQVWLGLPERTATRT